MQESFSLVVTEELEKKIRHMCNRLPTLEWSGTLFYTVEGSFGNKDLKIICKDMFIMDIGTATYTEFDMSPDVVAYLADNPDLMECYMGLIHSHNQMSTFFSGTDTATLREEGNKRNHFVSLIVNNDGKYTAGITRKVKSVKQVIDTYIYESFEDKAIQGKTTYNVEDERIEWFELNIEKKGEPHSFRELDIRIDEIRKEKEKQAKSAQVLNGVRREEPFPIQVKGTINAPLIKPPVNTHPTLFDDDDVPNYEDELPFDNFDIDEDLVNLQVARLITGAIGVNTDKFDSKKYVQNTMVKTFDKAFDKDMDLFEAWADMLSEFIAYYPVGIYENIDEDIYSEILAGKMLDKLEELPSNKYIEKLIKSLGRWTTREQRTLK